MHAHGHELHRTARARGRELAEHPDDPDDDRRPLRCLDIAELKQPRRDDEGHTHNETNDRVHFAREDPHDGASLSTFGIVSPYVARVPAARPLTFSAGDVRTRPRRGESVVRSGSRLLDCLTYAPAPRFTMTGGHRVRGEGGHGVEGG